jgi:hypothetical protein
MKITATGVVSYSSSFVKTFQFKKMQNFIYLQIAVDIFFTDCFYAGISVCRYNYASCSDAIDYADEVLATHEDAMKVCGWYKKITNSF